MRAAGADLQLTLRRHGFYPAGGGELHATIIPAERLNAIILTDRGATREAYVEALAPGLARSVPARELEMIGASMGWSGDQLRHGGTRQNEGPGNALIATLAYEHVTEVFTQYGHRGLSVDEVVKRLTHELRDYQKSFAPVGPHLADQLMLLQALAARDDHAGELLASEVTEHARTNARTIALFLPVSFTFTRIGEAWRIASTWAD